MLDPLRARLERAGWRGDAEAVAAATLAATVAAAAAGFVLGALAGGPAPLGLALLLGPAPAGLLLLLLRSGARRRISVRSLPISTGFAPPYSSSKTSVPGPPCPEK